MNKTYTTRGIILNRKDFREADRLFVVYTQDHGKIEPIAISVKKATSKMAKFLEPMMEVEMLVVRGRMFDRIAELKLINNFSEIKECHEKWALGCYCLELVDKLTKVDSSDKEIFVLIRDILNALKEDGNKDLVTFYVWKLLGHLGYQPKLNNCIECSVEEKPDFSKRDSTFFFDMNRGGLVCGDCQTSGKKGVKTTFKVVELLNRSGVENLVNFKTLEINREENQQLKQIVGSLLNFHLEYAINSMKFLR